MELKSSAHVPRVRQRRVSMSVCMSPWNRASTSSTSLSVSSTSPRVHSRSKWAPLKHQRSVLTDQVWRGVWSTNPPASRWRPRERRELSVRDWYKCLFKISKINSDYQPYILYKWGMKKFDVKVANIYLYVNPFLDSFWIMMVVLGFSIEEPSQSQVTCYVC